MTWRELCERIDSRVYRSAAKRLHPDAGGDPALFRKLTEAREILATVS